jgi:predicted nucleic acid-binding protein
VRIFVDTNVFVYLFDADEPAKQQRAREVVSELMRSGALALSSRAARPTKRPPEPKGRLPHA